ncbi:MAG: 3-hydroxyacyl-CoA dehydrogenase family protein [Desulfarculus sp.]|jgi:3-hydroxybutyryl-CoA dehydrogenase|nr:MAG: 3-hydroxyacyl-CoA dehydrogenase family protein [Desulfarculus sp.]
MAEKIEKVAVVGMGILGAQIAVQAACYGYQVCGFDQVEGSFAKASQGLLQALAAGGGKGPVMGLAAWKEGLKKVKLTSSLEQAVADADLVIEAVPENLELKRKVFAQIDALAPAPAILATNSSSIPISKIEGATQRPQQCLNLHFYFPIMGMNLIDVMGGSQTSEQTMQAGIAWTRSIGCIPLLVKKEIFGFCFNRIWRAVKREVLHMWADGFVDLEDVDRAWMVFTGMPYGPFGLMDQVGLDVIYNVELSYFGDSQDPRDRPPEALQAMVERGHLGFKTGKGFYDYPNPAYKDPGFLPPAGPAASD